MAAGGSANPTQARSKRVWTHAGGAVWVRAARRWTSTRIRRLSMAGAISDGWMLPDSAVGLSGGEARSLLERYGPNELSSEKHQNPAVRFLKTFLQPLPAILLLAAGVSLLIGQPIDATIITLMVTVSAVVDFYQTYQSALSMERLRNLVAPTATVLRDSAWVEIDRRGIVPGDLVKICAGDMVPADCMLLAARDLFVQEAALTGESMPSAKDAAAINDDRQCHVYLGTSVASGAAVARVPKTGRNTEFGAISLQLTTVQEETNFDRGLRQFAFLISRIVFFLVLFVLLANIAVHRNAFESLLFAVALAVGLTPELLPVLTSVTLAKAAGRMAEGKVIVKHLSAIQNLGSIDVLCSDKTGTLTSGHMSLVQSLDDQGIKSDAALEAAILNSRFDSGVKSPLDAAILAAGAVPDEYRKCDELPFDFQRRRISIVVENAAGRQMLSKGSPESILARCAFVRRGSGTITFDRERLAAAEAQFERLSQEGYRVLAVASKQVELKDRYDSGDEREMVFLGYLVFADPPREDAADAIAALGRDGVTVKVITGDHASVAQHLCRTVGIEAGVPLLGDELDLLTDTALAARVEQTNLFARVTPAQKTRILQSLRARGHVVGFIGDGINDAPSLRAADVGIAAPNAVDVARSAADIILSEPGYGILHHGVVEGRAAFGNVMKYLMMGTSSNFGNVISMAIAAVILPFLPMLPTQVLLNNFLYDLSQITIPADNVDPEYVAAPRKWDIRLVRRFMLLAGPISSAFDLLTFYVLLRVLHAGEAEFHTGWFIESLFTQVLVLLVIRTMHLPWRSRPSRPLLVSITVILAIGLALPFSPFAAMLGFTALPIFFFAFLLLATTIYLGAVELMKRWFVSSGKVAA